MVFYKFNLIKDNFKKLPTLSMELLVMKVLQSYTNQENQS